jgi:predicted permease
MIEVFFPGSDSLQRRDYWWLNVMGRLKPGWTVDRALSYLGSMSPGIFEATVPTGYKASTLEEYRRFQLAAFPAGNGVSWLRRMYHQSLLLLLGMTGLVLLIACANLANLMLARSSTRELEIAVRLALGASRTRLIRQLLSESILLAAAGAALGIAVSAVLSRVIVRFQSTDYDQVKLDLSTDWRVIAFTAAVAVATCVVFGLAPAWRSSRIEAGAAMKAGGRGMTAGRERFSFQRILVVTQIAISLVLLVGAALFVRSFQNLANLDPGFRKNGIVIAFMNLKRLNLAGDRYAPLKQELLEELKTIPEVEAAATTSHVPLDGSSWTLGVHVEGIEGSSKFTWASPNYFQTMQIPLIAGRDFNSRDTATSQPVAIVNETFVRKYFAGADPIGKTIRTSAEPNYPETNYIIVGVTKDTKYMDLREPIPPASFAPALQHPNPGPFQSFLIRSPASPAAVMSSVRTRIGSAHPAIGIGFTVFEKQIQDSLRRERLMAALSGFFGVVAALLAMVGLYGVISYMVVKRRHEIGIRMALGARRYQVVRLVMREAGLATVIGVGIGLLVSLAATRSAATLLFGLTPNDPCTMAAAAVLLAGIAGMATWLPAVHASRVDPMSALRDE